MNRKKARSVLTGILFICFSSFLISAEDDNNIQALVELISKGNTKQVKDCLDKNPELVNKQLKNGDYILHHSIAEGRLDIVQTLIDKYNANINLEGKDRCSPIVWAVRQNKADIVKLLIDRGADVNSKDTWLMNSIIWATWHNKLEIARLLVQSGANVNLVDEEYRTPLIYAAINNNLDFVNLLLEHNADLNIADKTNKTALSWAVTQNNIEIVNILIEKNADINIADSDCLTPLMLAVRKGNIEMVKKLLQKGATTNYISKDENQNALHIAAIFGYADITKLLQEKIDINNTDAFGMTPAMYAAKYGHHDVFKNLNSNKAIQNNFGFCPDLKSSDAKSSRVWYTGHSGWIVNTQNHILVFDYYKNGATPTEPLLANGYINPDEVKGKKVVLFITHEHSDHFDVKMIKELASTIKDLILIYGFKPEDSDRFKENRYDGPQYQYIGQREVKQIDGIKIITLKSIDSGVGFYVEVDGISIFHAGDHANNNQWIKQSYTEEIDFIAKHTNEVDIAFLPVTGCSSWQKEAVVDGFFMAVNKLYCKSVFPMHGGDVEQTYQEFVELGKQKNSNARILAVRYPGDGYSLDKYKTNKN